ncbi:septum site-determining protein MinD [Gracilibacillus ureilyticus]|uniref:Septum site-determining protein MinD n=1 Tax=Gracilibacillus ureilyticus TaxID=531814 RepID=A0A1H9RDK6_9BACI|nr:septum site-determining protein MinD [Gracilibacillus ureilyticus]SER70778.1 septum site-determining protein MinD [Gracilibacillus ureilyticus]
MAEIITITSGKGGVGKTTITANLGTALALLGKKVCLIDADFGLRNLDIPLGLSNRIVYDLSDYMNRRCELRHVEIKDKSLPNLSLIPSSQTDGQVQEPEQFKEIIEEIAVNFDYVLIDSPAGIESGFQNAAYAANDAIVVVTPFLSSIHDADRVIGILEDEMSFSPKVILNMTEENDKKAKSLNMISKEEIFDILQIKELGSILNDPEVIRSIERGQPVALNPQVENGLRFRHIARNMMTHQYDPYVPVKVKKKQGRIFPLQHKLKWISGRM